MSTWRLDVLLRPRGQESVGFIRSTRVHALAFAEADDVVAEASAACLLAWPGMELLRVLRCVALSRGDELRPAGDRR